MKTDNFLFFLDKSEVELWAIDVDSSGMEIASLGLRYQS